VAFSGFGQAVSATPLAMATIYGSVGAGHVIKPRLTVLADVDKHPRSPFLTQGTAEEQQRFLEIVRRGLSGVVFSDWGTANKHMAAKDRFSGRLYAKTGTAQIGPDTADTVWFAGWVEPATSPNGGGPASGISTRIAFVCMVTDEPDDTGGARCGPIINDILAALEGVPAAPPPPPPRRHVPGRR
jgi:cell division protein FtsI/penicillin-binding protein 2